MQPLQEYLERADELAQDVVNAWRQVGSAATSQFKNLFDKACLYTTAKRLADNHREYNVLSEEDAAKEK